MSLPYAKRLLLALVAASAVPSIATAGDYQCQSDFGCKATKDGETTVFRKTDIVSTEDGWWADPSDGWVNVTGQHGSMTTQGSGSTYFTASGAAIYVRRYSSAPMQGSNPGGAEVSWKHDIDGPGPLQPITVSVQYHPALGATPAENMAIFQAQVRDLLLTWPPNVGPTVGG